MTTRPAVVCIGTSLTFGYNQNSNPYPARLATLTGRPVVNLGVGGDRIASISSRFTQMGAPFPFGVGVLEGLTNDLALDSMAGTTAAAAFLALADAMHTAGIPRVVGVLIPPRTNSSNWDNTKEAERVIANAAIVTGAASRPWMSVVDSNAVLGDGVTPPALQASYDYGDHLHLSSAGLQALADAVAALL